MGEHFHLLLIGTNLIEDTHALFEYTSPAKRETILRQIAARDPLRHDKGAIIQGLKTGYRLQKSGLTGSVAAHDADAVRGIDQPIEAVKQ